MKNEILIQDWIGNVLFRGDADDPEVLRIMQLNEAPNDDIYVSWTDETDERNVYEHIYW